MDQRSATWLEMGQRESIGAVDRRRGEVSTACSVGALSSLRKRRGRLGVARFVGVHKIFHWKCVVFWVRMFLGEREGVY